MKKMMVCKWDLRSLKSARVRVLCRVLPISKKDKCTTLVLFLLDMIQHSMISPDSRVSVYDQ
jgi:hypothetical protein